MTLHGLRGSTQQILLPSSDKRLCIYKCSEENSGCQIRQWAHCRCLLIPALVHGCEHLSTVKFNTFTFVLNRISKKPLSVGSPSVSLQSSPPHIKYKNELKKGTLLSHGRPPESSRIFSLVEAISLKIWENSAMRNFHFGFRPWLKDREASAGVYQRLRKYFVCR